MKQTHTTPATLTGAKALVNFIADFIITFLLLFYFLPVMSFLTTQGFTTLLHSDTYCIVGGIFSGLFSLCFTLATYTRND